MVVVMMRVQDRTEREPMALERALDGKRLARVDDGTRGPVIRADQVGVVVPETRDYLDSHSGMLHHSAGVARGVFTAARGAITAAVSQLVKSRFSLAPHEDEVDNATCEAILVEFDFGSDAGSVKLAREIDFDEAHAAMKRGCFVWMDLDARHPPQARAMLRRFSIAENAIDEALTGEPSTQNARYDDYLHLVVSGCRERNDDFVLERVDVFIAERFMLTIHRGP